MNETGNIDMSTPATVQPTHINGLPLAGLQEVVDTLGEAPEQGVLTFETRTRWLGGMRTRSEVEAFEMGGQRIERTHVIECDEPQQIFGHDEAASPQELLLGAVGSCMSAIWAVQATMAGIELRSLEVHMRGTLDMRGSLELANVPQGFPEVTCIVRVDADASAQQLQEIHDKVQKTSPNFYNLTTAIPARAQLVVKT
jgi:uncharacterized OsmC-like protein